MNRGPNEEGKAGQDNEQSPEDQDTHACNITQISTAVQALTHGRLLRRYFGSHRHGSTTGARARS
jgi:hypothetical protein